MKIYEVGLVDYEIDVTMKFTNKDDADAYYVSLCVSYDCEVFYSEHEE